MSNEVQWLKRAIEQKELELFSMKALLSMLPNVRIQNSIDSPDSHRCTTCGNHQCLTHDLPKSDAKTIIANQTAMNGCLAWLPIMKVK